MVALRKCVDEMLPGWGIDPKTFAALQKPPTEIRGKYWISGEDYPADAQRADWSGYLVVRLDVEREIRYLDKLIDELAKGKAMGAILRA
ncbi:hypothetical protein GCM10023264_13490 [Sphingomonas daechungensis]|uniref:DUF2200 family protein n=1 Tax=Sphingomonas daechungensis TaxID=1176646 RepID=UPI0031E9EC1A